MTNIGKKGPVGMTGQDNKGVGMKNADIYKKALALFPERLKIVLSDALLFFEGTVYEIRMHTNASVYFSTDSGIKFLNSNGRLSSVDGEFCYTCTGAELREIVSKACSYSVFARQNELSRGYVTYLSGIRIGVISAGTPDGFSLSGVTGLNIRLPFNGLFIENEQLGHLLAAMDTGLLIAGPPSSGKTTMLKFCCRFLSSGKNGSFKKLCVIDERNELSENVFFNGRGLSLDIISGYEKSDAIERALRLFSPDIIVCDEIGSEDEVRGILSGLNSGVKFIATIHAADIMQICRRRQFRELFRENVFDSVVFLSQSNPGNIKNIYSYEVIEDAIHKYNNDMYVLHSDGDLLCKTS